MCQICFFFGKIQTCYSFWEQVPQSCLWYSQHILIFYFQMAMVIISNGHYSSSGVARKSAPPSENTPAVNFFVVFLSRSQKKVFTEEPGVPNASVAGVRVLMPMVSGSQLAGFSCLLFNHHLQKADSHRMQ